MDSDFGGVEIATGFRGRGQRPDNRRAPATRINDYAEQVAKALKDQGFRVEASLRSEKIGAKIRDAQLQKVPFMLVLGDRELEENVVAVRERTRGDLGAMTLQQFSEMARRLVDSRAISND